MLVIEAGVISDIGRHVAKCIGEACGLIFGSGERWWKTVAITNRVRENFEYEMDDREVFQAVDREQHAKWVGVYHSHVGDDLYLSAGDIESMKSGLWYLIVNREGKFRIYQKLGRTIEEMEDYKIV